MNTQRCMISICRMVKKLSTGRVRHRPHSGWRAAYLTWSRPGKQL